MLGFPAAGIPDKTWQPPLAVLETTSVPTCTIQSTIRIELL